MLFHECFPHVCCEGSRGIGGEGGGGGAGAGENEGANLPTDLTTAKGRGGGGGGNPPTDSEGEGGREAAHRPAYHSDDRDGVDDLNFTCSRQTRG